MKAPLLNPITNCRGSTPFLVERGRYAAQQKLQDGVLPLARRVSPKCGAVAAIA
jgi:hypothetical protein